jgi:hypothetical protein
MLMGAVAALLWHPDHVVGDVQQPAAAITAEDCQMNALTRSACIFELILEDLKANYPFTDGGGITSIKQNSTTSFTASISQEERVDQVIYEIEFGSDGSVSIANKEVGADTK